MAYGQLKPQVYDVDSTTKILCTDDISRTRRFVSQCSYLKDLCSLGEHTFHKFVHCRTSYSRPTVSIQELWIHDIR